MTSIKAIMPLLTTIANFGTVKEVVQQYYEIISEKFKMKMSSKLNSWKVLLIKVAPNSGFV